MESQKEKWINIFRNSNYSDLMEETPNYIEVVNDFLVPDKINADLFRANIEVMDVGMLELYQGQYEPTPNIERFIYYTHRPMGYPLWFLAAYPDVAEWFTANIKDNMNLFYTATDTNEEYFKDESNFDNDKFKTNILRKLISYYIKTVNNSLECSKNPTTLETISGSILGDSMLPSDMKALMLVNDGENEMKLNNSTGALQKFSQAISIHPTARAYCLRGNVYFDDKDFNKALNDYNSCINIDDSFAPAYLGRAAIRMSNGNRTGACADLKKAYELGMNDAYDLYRKLCL